MKNGPLVMLRESAKKKMKQTQDRNEEFQELRKLFSAIMGKEQHKRLERRGGRRLKSGTQPHRSRFTRKNKKTKD